MKIDWIEYEDMSHVLAWFLLEVMSQAGIEKFGKFDSSKLDVVLTINGIEVSIADTFENLQNQLETNLKVAANETAITTLVDEFEAFVKERNLK